MEPGYITLPASDVAFFDIIAFSTSSIFFYIASSTTRSLMDPKLLLKMLLQRRRTTIQISISRGVHRWPLCFAIRHAVNAKSVVKLHVCYGESRLFLPFNIGCQPNCKVTDFTH